MDQTPDRSATADSPMRLLVISRHFGPNASTGGFRWHGLVEHLREHGWAFDVLSGESGSEADIESDRASDDHEVTVHRIAARSLSARVLRAAISFPHRLRTLLLGILAAVGRPGRRDEGARNAGETPSRGRLDHGEIEPWSPGQRRPLHSRIVREIEALADAVEVRRWNAEVRARAEVLLRERPYRAMVISSPPHGSQQLGLELTRDHDIPWIADFRDPCVYGLARHAELLPALTRLRWRKLEAEVLTKSQIVIYNTERHRDAVDRESAEVGAARWVIRNGYDHVALARRPDPAVFRVAYAGWLHPFMDVRLLLDPLARLIHHHELRPAECRIEIIGAGPTFAGVPLGDLAAGYGIEGFVDLIPRMPRPEALSRLERASVLVAFGCLHSLCVPMKVFDYARLRGVLLLIGNRDGALADVARELGVHICPFGDKARIHATLQDALDRWRTGSFDRVNDPDGRLHRSRQAERLRHLLLEHT